MRCNRAVSELIGAILILAIIVSAAGILYLKFQPTINQGVDDLKYSNAKKEMVELRELMERVRMDVEPSTSKFITLDGGNLVLDKGSFEIAVDGDTYKLGKLELKVNSRTLSLETGVFESDNPIPISYPVILRTPEKIYIAFYNLSGSLSAGGDRYNLRVTFRDISVLDGVSEVVIRSENCEAWKRVLSEVGVPHTDNCPQSVVISSAGNITVSIYSIEVR